MEKFAPLIVNALHEALVLLDQNLCVQAVNDSFCRLAGVAGCEAQGRHIEELLSAQTGINVTQRILATASDSGQESESLAVEYDFSGAGRRSIQVDVRSIEGSDSILLILEDVTERRRAEDKIQELAARLTAAKHRERRRIASLLHDDIQQQLYAIALRLSAAKDDIRSGKNSEALSGLAEVEEHLLNSRDALHHMAADLCPPILLGEGLTDALEWLASHMKRQFGLVAFLNVEGSPPRLSDEMRVLVYRCIRELLFNVVKHSGTLTANVEVRTSADQFVVIVSDRGDGFDPDVHVATDSESLGLMEFREELGHFGGSLEIASAPDQGTRVTVRVPLRCTLAEIPLQGDC